MVLIIASVNNNVNKLADELDRFYVSVSSARSATFCRIAYSTQHISSAHLFRDSLHPMPVGIEAWVTQIPPITRGWLILAVLTSLAVVSKIQHPDKKSHSSYVFKYSNATS